MSAILRLLLALPALAARAEPPLAAAVRQVRYTSECRELVRTQDNVSYPVPARTERGPRWRLLFYPAMPGGRPGDLAAHGPSLAAEFGTDGRDLRCGALFALPPGDRAQALGPVRSPEGRRLGDAAFLAREAELYDALAAAAEAFFSGKTGPAARRTAADVLRLFTLVSEPGLKAHYRAMSPEFWAWAQEAAKP